MWMRTTLSNLGIGPDARCGFLGEEFGSGSLGAQCPAPGQLTNLQNPGMT